MALASIAVPADEKRDARARELVDSVATWPLHTLKVSFGAFEAGTVFRRAYGSNGKRYLVNAVACECPDYQQSHNICKHVRAVVLWEARQAERAARMSEPLPSVYDSDELVFAAAGRRPSYADLLPPCKAGCGDVAESRDGYCDRCASDREWQARRASLATVAPFTLNPLAE